ncbi:MAG: hypothetical protein II604_00795 [Bacteroidales bacterium]|nr:hypothetical protein [Bacteroidales bacterium]
MIFARKKPKCPTINFNFAERVGAFFSTAVADQFRQHLSVRVNLTFSVVLDDIGNVDLLESEIVNDVVDSICASFFGESVRHHPFE